MPLSEATKNTVKKLSVNELLTYYMFLSQQWKCCQAAFDYTDAVLTK